MQQQMQIFTRIVAAATVVAAMTSGCIWDKASIEPRTVIRMERDRNAATALPSGAAASGATAQSQNTGQTNDIIGFGVAPYVSVSPIAGAITGTNSSRGSAPTAATGTIGSTVNEPGSDLSASALS